MALVTSRSKLFVNAPKNAVTLWQGESYKWKHNNTFFFVLLPHKLPIILALDFSYSRTSKRVGIRLCFKGTLILSKCLENHSVTKYNIGYDLVQDWQVYKSAVYTRTGLYHKSPVSKSWKFFNFSSWSEKLQFSDCFPLVFTNVVWFSLFSLTPWQIWSNKAEMATQSLMHHSGDIFRAGLDRHFVPCIHLMHQVALGVSSDAGSSKVSSAHSQGKTTPKGRRDTPAPTWILDKWSVSHFGG